MTNEEILRLAEVSKVTDPDLGLGMTDYGDSSTQLVEFARAIAAAEREACAKICEDIAQNLHYSADVESCSFLIRMRK